MTTNQKHKKIVENLIEMKDVVVPILGEDIFFVSKNGTDRNSIHQYLLECFISEYGDNGLTMEDKAIIVKESYYGLSKLERFFSSDFETDYRCYIRNAKKNGWIHIDETVAAFLEVFRFPLIITTTAFDFLEEMLPMGRYNAITYSPNSTNAVRIETSKTTIYHIFGTISDGGRWVYDEDKLLEFLHSLHDADTTATSLKQYIDSKNCRLLAIGCNLPDWLFRFLWYPIKSGSIDNKQKKGYWINARENTESFNDFLDNIKFYSSTEVTDILALAVHEMQAQESNQSTVEEMAIYDAFISYASEDKPIVQKIFDILTHQGYKIWFDKDGSGKIEAGSNYMKRIESGIERSNHYIPIITGNFINKVLNPESNLKKEVDLVRNHFNSLPIKPERYSIPIIIDGSSFNDEIITSSLVEGMTRFFLPKQLFLEINMYPFATTDSSIDFTL
jgi:hypothetical protein